jgi:hypothetical protein
MSLILESSDISPYNNANNYPFSQITYGQNGYMTGCRTNATYYVDLLKLLGEDYKKYDMFQLELLQFAYGVKSSNSSSTFNGYAGASTTNLITRVSGLRFVNGQSSVFLGGFHFFRSNVQLNYNFSNGSERAIFYKPSDPRVELNLRLYSQAEIQDIPASWFTASTHVAPPTMYSFRITPYIEEYTEIFKQPLY